MAQDIINQEKEFVKLKISYESLNYIFEHLNPLTTLKKEIEAVMDQDGVILDEASVTLYQIRKEIKKNENLRREKIKSNPCKKSSMLNENVIVIRNDRYCLPVKKSSKMLLKAFYKMNLAVEPLAISNPLKRLN